MLVNSEGKAITSPLHEVIWPATMEETKYMKPYLVSLFGPNTIPIADISAHKDAQNSQQLYHNPSLQIRSTLHPASYTQTIPFPFSSETHQPSSTTHTLRLLATSPPSNLYCLSTPLDKQQITNDGSTLWAVSIKPWDVQIDELILEALYEEALALLDVIDKAVLPAKVLCTSCVPSLYCNSFPFRRI